MSSRPVTGEAAAALRGRAERQVGSRGPPGALAGSPPGPGDEAILHELRVHQVELEMQNEELLRTQGVLDEARARYFDLYDLAPVGYCTLDEAGVVLEANLTAATLLGVARNTLGNQPFTRFLLPVDQDVYYLHRKELKRSGERQTCEVRMRKGDGAPFWAELVTTLAVGPDGVPVQRVILSDVTDRKRMEAAMLAKHAEFECARELAQAASAAKSEFLSRMSHELRTPLNAVLGFAQLMESASPPPGPDQRESLGQILGAGWSLLGLIDELLDLSALESGKLTAVTGRVALAEVLVDCEALVGPRARAAGIQLTVGAPTQPCFVRADRSRLNQVLLTLLSNAIAYTPPGGAVEVAWGVPAAGRVRVSVRDTGAALSAERLAHVFEPFSRLGREEGDEPGAGIGLAVSRRLTEAMGGEIGAQSTPGVGSVFWIELAEAEA